jgi:hypothetical protein
MPHPLVLQLRFARSEFQRALVGLTDDEARRRFLPMNCISWNIGHLAWQEQRCWLWRAQGQILLRMIYHYWYHTGENMAIRQMPGHTGLPDFVGDSDGEAPYRPEQQA